MEHLKATLRDLDLAPIPGFPCLYTSKHLVVLFYVDDIIVLAHPSRLLEKQAFEDRMVERYNLRCMGDVKWFLGIRVIRDQPRKQIFLIQDSFIDKVATDFNLYQTSSRYPDVPLTVNDLPPSDEPPSLDRTHRYQSLVGSLAFISTFTRPDVARSHSVLARHLQNPGELHYRHAVHCWRYLIGKKNWAIRTAEAIQDRDIYAKVLYNDQVDQINQGDEEPVFYGASDASFADEAETRRSSQGFLYKLYGMPIDWKATVQRTVTRSTTEAELLALSVAGVEMEQWNRFFKLIKFNPEISPTLWCDNKQTVQIVN